MNKSLTLLQINDTHAYLESHQELFWKGKEAVYKKVGGYARIATLIKEIKAEIEKIMKPHRDKLNEVLGSLNSRICKGQ